MRMRLLLLSTAAALLIAACGSKVSLENFERIQTGMTQKDVVSIDAAPTETSAISIAGVSGGMYAMNFEIATAEVVVGARSGAYLLFTFLGGALFFFGPIIGAVMMVLATVLLSEMTKAWLLYLGIFFLVMVMYAPGGVSGLIMMNLRLAAYGMLRRLWTSYLALAGTLLVVLTAVGVIVEMIYHIKLNEAMGPEMTFMGATINTQGADAWVGATFLLITGVGLFELVRRQFVHQWSQIQEDIEAENLRRQMH